MTMKSESNDNLRSTEEIDENLHRVMSDISQGYPNDIEAMSGEFGHNDEQYHAVTNEDLIEKPDAYLRRNPDNGHSAREIVQDIVDPMDSEWVHKAIDQFSRTNDGYFMNPDQKDSIEEDMKEEFENEKERYSTDPSDYNLVHRILGTPVEDAEDFRTSLTASCHTQTRSEWRSQSEENIRETYEAMPEDQKREFVVDQITDLVQESLENAYDANSIGRLEELNETDSTSDPHGNQRYIVFSN